MAGGVFSKILILVFCAVCTVLSLVTPLLPQQVKTLLFGTFVALTMWAGMSLWLATKFGRGRFIFGVFLNTITTIIVIIVGFASWDWIEQLIGAFFGIGLPELTLVNLERITILLIYILAIYILLSVIVFINYDRGTSQNNNQSLSDRWNSIVLITLIVSLPIGFGVILYFTPTASPDGRVETDTTETPDVTVTPDAMGWRIIGNYFNKVSSTEFNYDDLGNLGSIGFVYTSNTHASKICADITIEDHDYITEGVDDEVHNLAPSLILGWQNQEEFYYGEIYAQEDVRELRIYHRSLEPDRHEVLKGLSFDDDDVQFDVQFEETYNVCFQMEPNNLILQVNREGVEPIILDLRGLDQEGHHYVVGSAGLRAGEISVNYSNIEVTRVLP